jgi:hypothetical protein
MRGGATEVNETHKWATSKKRLRTSGLDDLNKPRLAPPQMSSKNVRRIDT